MTGGTLDVGGRAVRLTSPEKVLWPASGDQPATTKADLVAYLAAVSPALLGQLAGRPLSRIRWPHGVGAAEEPASGAALSFVEKNAPTGTPVWVRTVRLPGTGRRGAGTRTGGESVDYPVLDDLAGLVWTAQLAALELHTPQWRVDATGRVLPPDRLVLDLDPGPGVGLAECAALALRLRDRLADDGLDAVPVTSGSSGLHLYAALAGDQDADVVRAYARALAEAAAREDPLVVSTMTRSARTGRVLIDWSQNSGSKTTATPYSPRGRPGSPAVAPRAWSEIGPGLRQLTLREVAVRYERDGDLMAAAPGPGPRLPVR